MHNLPVRQIHLDFHTSPAIPDVGIDFDPEEFVSTLQNAHVNSITIFAKGHHGYSYYPTEIGVPHPHLQRLDLMGEMITACKAAGIRVVTYTTLTWDELAWETHQEWRQITPEGCFAGIEPSPLKPGWKNLCMNSGYGDYVLDQMVEILETYDADGMFIDIVTYFDQPCVCATCLAQMQKEGVDPTDPIALRGFMRRSERRFVERAARVIHARKPDQSVFFNARLKIDWDPELGMRPELDAYTHLEIEALPGGAWGYDHFPLSVRYFQTLGKPIVGMTGRFHTVWGDFGGLRNRAALAFESFQALAHGAAVSIGDQLHPRGRLNPAVYQRIGEVFAEVEQREQWSIGSEHLPDIGVVVATTGLVTHEGEFNEADRGALHVLEQLHHQFEFIDADGDLSRYRLVILPDATPMNEALADRLRTYLDKGGRLLITGRSGIDENRNDFYLSQEMGVHLVGPAPYAPDYLVLGQELGKGLDAMSHVCEQQGVQIEAGDDTQVLAWSGYPYFNRTWDHFCSHQYAPMARVSDDPVIVQKDNVIYIARPLFTEYAMTGRCIHRDVLGAAIRRLLPEPRILESTLPTTAKVIARRLGDDLILHLLNYVPQRRGKTLDIVEDVIPLYDVSLSVRVESEPMRVMIQPEDVSLVWEWEGVGAHFTIPVIDGYQIVVLEGGCREQEGCQ